MPIQAKAASGVKGTVVLNNELTDGLSDIDGFSHIILIYHFHKSEGYKLKVTPFWMMINEEFFQPGLRADLMP